MTILFTYGSHIEAACFVKTAQKKDYTAIED